MEGRSILPPLGQDPEMLLVDSIAHHETPVRRQPLDLSAHGSWLAKLPSSQSSLGSITFSQRVILPCKCCFFFIAGVALSGQFLFPFVPEHLMRKLRVRVILGESGGPAAESDQVS